VNFVNIVEARFPCESVSSEVGTAPNMGAIELGFVRTGLVSSPFAGQVAANVVVDICPFTDVRVDFVAG